MSDKCFLKRSGFTLIELLVVVAIIGILAAVGVNTFSGFQEKAKISTVKAIHKNVEKYIRAELFKCDLGDATIFNNGEYGPLSCTGKYGATGSNPKAAIYVRDRIGDNGKIFNDKNPFDTANFAVKRGGTWVLGHIILHANPTTLTLYTCFKDPCGLAANHINTPISIP